MSEGGLLHFHFQHGVHEGLEGGFGLLLRDARLETAEGVDPAIAALLQHVNWVAQDNLRLHHDGNKEVRRKTEFDAVKALLSNADNGHFVIVQIQSFADNLGIGGKTSFPKAVVENNIRMAAGDDIIGGGEDASEDGDDAESGKVGAGNEFHLD